MSGSKPVRILVCGEVAWAAGNRPADFDVIVTTNMFRDILSNLAEKSTGDLSLAGSLSAGESCAAAQGSRGSVPDIAGRNLANPTSVMHSAAMLHDRLGKRWQLDDLGTAAAESTGTVDEALPDSRRRTRNFGGELGTKAFSTSLVAAIDRTPRPRYDSQIAADAEGYDAPLQAICSKGCRGHRR